MGASQKHFPVNPSNVFFEKPRVILRTEFGASHPGGLLNFVGHRQGGMSFDGF
jgi:hypothetical protein